MDLDVRIIGEEIEVICSLTTEKEEFSFALALSLPVSVITDHGTPIPFDTEAIGSLSFRPEMTKYTVRNLQKGELTILYRGKLTGIFGYLREDLIHFSFYNGWYPQEFDAEPFAAVTLHLDDRWEMVHGSYNFSKKLWLYKTPPVQTVDDCNILLLNRDHYSILDSDTVKVYCVKGEDAAGQEYLSVYSSIRDFYISLYGTNKIGKTDLVFLDVPDRLGAYFRDGLIVNTNPPGNIAAERHGIAHEMGHAYGSGADTGSWEDWLNETTAEWSALLYEEAHDPAVFRKELDACRERLEGESLCLREKGDTRPEDVHETGTLIYGTIYRKYGGKAIKVLLRTFDTLEKKTTAQFLAVLRNQGNDVLATEIEEHLN